MASVGHEDTIILRRSRGSILHDFYNCCERVFKAIAVEVNGGYAESDQWHKALLHRLCRARHRRYYAESRTIPSNRETTRRHSRKLGPERARACRALGIVSGLYRLLRKPSSRSPGR
jgi:hypothetical protein